MTSNFQVFLKKFPAIKLPVSITEDTASEFALENEPLNERLIADFISPVEILVEPDDDMTEYVPCFRIDGLKEFHALIYWKASLMNYQYILVTFDKAGKLIDRQVVAGTFSDGKTITRSVAKLDEDMTIYIVSGQLEGSDQNYDAQKSTAREIELLPDGRLMEFA